VCSLKVASALFPAVGRKVATTQYDAHPELNKGDFSNAVTTLNLRHRPVARNDGLRQVTRGCKEDVEFLPSQTMLYSVDYVARSVKREPITSLVVILNAARPTSWVVGRARFERHSAGNRLLPLAGVPHNCSKLCAACRGVVGTTTDTLLDRTLTADNVATCARTALLPYTARPVLHLL
jgi:hypothetical protein